MLFVSTGKWSNRTHYAVGLYRIRQMSNGKRHRLDVLVNADEQRWRALGRYRTLKAAKFAADAHARTGYTAAPSLAERVAKLEATLDKRGRR